MRIKKVSQVVPIVEEASIVDAYSTSTTNGYSCNYVNGLNGKVLWTNSSSTSNFSAQTINLSETLDNYDCYEIIFKQSTTNTRIMTSGRIPVGSGTILFWGSSNYYYRPTSSTVSGLSIAFEDCKWTGGTANENTIPMYVIGYKTGLFD